MLILFRPFTSVKVVFIKQSLIATSRCFSRNCPYKHSKQYLPDQTHHIGPLGSGSTLIGSMQSTEGQCLENKTDLYKAITLLKCVMLLTSYL